MTATDKPLAGIRVVHLIAGLDATVGGPPASAAATATSVRGAGAGNTFAFAYSQLTPDVQAAAERLRQRGVDVRGFPETRRLGRAGHRWGISPSLARWLFAHRADFDIVHAHGAWTMTAVTAAVVAKLARRPVVLSTHESLTDFDLAKSSLVERVVKRAIRAVFLRAFDLVVVASDLERASSGATSRMVVIPHAVAGAGESSSRPVAGDGLRVGTLARIHPKKNFEVLIDALALLPDATLIVGGDGPEEYRNVLAARAEALGVENRIDWRGFVDAEGKAQLLADIDVFALPSAYECFGVAVVEAMRAAIPVVVSPTVGVAPFVSHTECGYVVDPEASAVAEAVRRAADSRGELGSRGATAAAAEFGYERHGARLAECFLRLLGRRTGGAVA
jgi:glycosyltransferase involved in cell wall biosynthesis